MEYIEREAAIEAISKLEFVAMDVIAADSINGAFQIVTRYMDKQLRKLPAADVRPVVLCRDCINYVESEEVNGEKMCVRDADWCVDDGCYYGFTEYPSPDWFCADGEKREES